MKHINIKQIINALFTCLLLLVFIACGSNKLAIPYQSDISQNPKIIFLTYDIYKDDNEKKSVTFVNQKIADGKIKIKSIKALHHGQSGDLVCSQLDKHSKTLNSTLIKNPLIKTIEYLDESKNFTTKTIKTNKTQFSVRLQLNPDTKYLTISNFAFKKPLIKTKLHKE